MFGDDEITRHDGRPSTRRRGYGQVANAAVSVIAGETDGVESSYTLISPDTVSVIVSSYSTPVSVSAKTQKLSLKPQPLTTLTSLAFAPPPKPIVSSNGEPVTSIGPFAPASVTANRLLLAQPVDASGVQFPATLLGGSGESIATASA